MVKNLHFCTEKLLKQLKSEHPTHIITFRTGWIPTIYKGDAINLNERNPNGKDFFIRKGTIIDVRPIQYKTLSRAMYKDALIEIKKYNRKFHPEHWFFVIIIKMHKIGDN